MTPTEYDRLIDAVNAEERAELDLPTEARSITHLADRIRNTIAAEYEATEDPLAHIKVGDDDPTGETMPLKALDRNHPDHAALPFDACRAGLSCPSHPDTRPDFQGHETRECGEHRTVGPHRAWCFDCAEWCYPEIPCKGCELPILRARLAADGGAA